MKPWFIAVPSLCLLILSSINCASVQRQTPSMIDREILITSGELRLYAYDYQSWFISVVESTANQIFEEEQDPMIRENTLRWKTNAISAVQGATFRVDPLTAMGDAWGLTLQMYLYFQEGSGNKLFGERQELAVNASKRLEEEAFRMVESMVGIEQAAAVRKRLTNWARENPFTDLTFGRRSAMLDAATITAVQLGTGGLGSVVQIEEFVKDLSLRLSMYAEQLPKQVRWNSELLVAEMRREFINDTLADIASIDDSAVRIADFADGTPELIAGEREVVLAKIEQELTRILEDIDRQRVETIGVLQSEIGTAEDTLSKELDDALQALKQEREALIAELEDYSERTFDRASQESKELLDYLFWRVMHLVLLVAVVVVLVMFFSRYVLRSKRNQA